MTAPTDDDLCASYLREFAEMQRCTVIQWDDGTEFEAQVPCWPCASVGDQ